MKSLQLSSPKFLSKFLKQHINLAFWVVLIALIVYGGVILLKSWNVVKLANQSPEPVKKTREVRVDFKSYEADVVKITGNNEPASSTPLTANPFNAAIDQSSTVQPN